MREVQTVRSTQHHGSRGGVASPACVVPLVRGTDAGLSSSFDSISLPLSCVPSLHGRYPLPRYYGRSDSRRPGSQTLGLSNLPAPTGLPDYLAGPSDRSVSNHPRDDRGCPGCPATRLPAYRPLTGFAFHSQARPSTLTESSSRRLPTREACVTDWSFSFRCSPPRVATTQLRFDTARLFAAQERTSSALSQHPLRRTSAVTRHRIPKHARVLPSPIGVCVLHPSRPP